MVAGIKNCFKASLALNTRPTTWFNLGKQGGINTLPTVLTTPSSQISLILRDVLEMSTKCLYVYIWTDKCETVMLEVLKHYGFTFILAIHFS